MDRRRRIKVRYQKDRYGKSDWYKHMMFFLMWVGHLYELRGGKLVGKDYGEKT